jgi:tetratricopeptide (TPR) repeat protein
MNSKDLETLEKRGYELARAGLCRDADAVFAELIARYPKDHRGYQGAAWTAEIGWQWRQALIYWDKCLTLAGMDRDTAVLRRAHCLHRIGEIDKARALFAGVHNVEGAVGLAQLMTEQDGQAAGAAEWDRCIKSFSDHVEPHLGKAEYLMARDEHASAEALLGGIVEMWPEATVPRIRLAQCAAARKDWETAEERWKPVLESFGENPELRKAFARYLAVRGDFTRLTSWMARIVEQPVAFAECLAEYHLARDDYGAAAEQARKLVEIEPQWLESRMFLARILLRHGSRPALSAALSILRHVYEATPESVEIAATLADAFIRIGEDEQAIEFIQGITRADRRPQVEILRAWLAHKEQIEPEARRHSRSVLERAYYPSVHARIHDLRRISPAGPEPGAGEILLVSVMRNEIHRLDWFLTTYRKLGVDRFMIVDNDSSDGTTEILLKQPDVILYQTTDRYSLAGAGVRWANELIERHGRSNWCVYVDADEELIFPGSENVGLRELVKYLGANGYDAIFAPLIDMFPLQIPAKATDGAIHASYSYFDADLYIEPQAACPYREVYGGVRRRLFQGYHWLTKVPVINGAAGIKYLMSTHRITPANIADITGALLHYHLAGLLQPEYQALLDEAIDNREFPSSSLERLRSREVVRRLQPLKDLRSKNSLHYDSTRQLTELGIMHPGRSQFIE